MCVSLSEENADFGKVMCKKAVTTTVKILNIGTCMSEQTV